MVGIQIISEEIISFKIDNETKNHISLFKDKILRPFKDLVKI